jgi:hypothetical protein
MPDYDLLVVIVLGGLFILLGAGFLIWGKNEKRDYYKAISTRSDVREYMEHTPERPEPGGLIIGGVIALLLGLFILALGGALWIWS